MQKSLSIIRISSATSFAKCELYIKRLRIAWSFSFELTYHYSRLSQQLYTCQVVRLWRGSEVGDIVVAWQARKTRRADKSVPHFFRNYLTMPASPNRLAMQHNSRFMLRPTASPWGGRKFINVHGGLHVTIYTCHHCHLGERTRYRGTLGRKWRNVAGARARRDYATRSTRRDYSVKWHSMLIRSCRSVTVIMFIEYNSNCRDGPTKSLTWNSFKNNR